MKKNDICIDISNVVPGKGGTGGGIATYAINLITHLDSILTPEHPKVYCIKNIDFKSLDDLKNIIVKDVDVNNSNFISRLTWLHLRLPKFCIANNIKVLHRIVPELPAIKVCKYIVTVHDFMFDFYLERPALKKYLPGANLLKFKLFKALAGMAVRISDRIIVPAETILFELRERFPKHGHKATFIYEASASVRSEKREKKKLIH
ncbi:MAG: hypothetical protein ABI683_02700 [Ginsengibacter sp.]